MDRIFCRWAVALAGLFFTSSAMAAFEGRLLLPDGQPAGGYSVTVVGASTTVPCNPDGRFHLDPAPTAPFVLIASGPNGEVSAPIEIVEATEGVVEVLIPDTVRDSVTVVSGLAPTMETLPGNAAVVLTQEELEQRAPQRLVQVLESVAGASKLGDGVDSVPALRGLARGRTLILLDGARVTAERRAGPSATFIDPSSLASVEVLRGPSSVVYGSDAFGGVINAISRDPEAGLFQVRFGLEGSLGAQDQQSAFVALSGDVGGGSLLGEIYGRDADNGEAGGGEEIFNSGFSGQGLGLRYLRPVGPGFFRLGLAVDRNEDLGKSAIDSRAITAIYPREDSDRFTASWIGQPGAGWDSLETSLFYGIYRLWLDRDRVATPTTNRRIDRSDIDSKDASLRAVGARQLGGGRFQLGFEAHSRFGLEALVDRLNFSRDGVTVTSAAPTRAIEDASQLNTGLFATWNREVAPKVGLGLAARADRFEAENQGGFFGDRSASDQALSGNVSVTFGPWANLSHTLQASRGYRTPTLSDRYFRGPSGRGFVVGNPDLDAESSLQFDYAARWNRNRTAVGFYAYHYEIEDLIERFQSGDNFLFRNRGKATIEGLELEVQTAVNDHWNGELGLAVADGEADGNNPIDDISPPNGWVTLRYAFSKGYAYGRVNAFLEKDDPGPSEFSRPGFTTFDLGGGYRFGRGLEVRLIARNLTDKRYFAAADNAADRALGRSFTVGLSGKF